MTVFNGTDEDDAFTGGVDNDTIDGLGGDDSLSGGYGDDIIRGGSGHNSLNGREGDDILVGGDDGNYLYDNDNATLIGGAGSDSAFLYNYHGSEDLSSPGPADVLYQAGAGGDYLYVERYETLDEIAADMGAGPDHVILRRLGGSLTLTLGEGPGDGILFEPEMAASWGSITVADFAPGAGGDHLGLGDLMGHKGSFLSNALQGWEGAGNPFGLGYLRLRQDGASTVLEIDTDGGADSYQALVTFMDTIATDFGAENFSFFDPMGAAPEGGIYFGSENADTFIHGAGDDLQIGGKGNDSFWDWFGADTQRGGAGDDIFFDDHGADKMYGGDGADRFFVDSGNDMIRGGAGADQVYFQRTGGRDTHAEIFGGAGDDLINSRSTIADLVVHIYGGAGADLVSVSAGQSAIYVSLGGGRDRIQVGQSGSAFQAAIVTDFDTGARGDSVVVEFGYSPFSAGQWALEQRGDDVALVTAGASSHFDLLIFQDTELSAFSARNFDGYDPFAT